MAAAAAAAAGQAKVATAAAAPPARASAMESESNAAAGGGSSAECTVANDGANTTAASAAPGSWRQTYYLVQDLMDTDLHRVIQSAAKGNRRSPTTTSAAFATRCCGMYACHSAQVLHRDLKPSNLLVNKDCTLRIGDFGLARGVDEAHTESNALTEYVVTRWYRAPELLCGNESYGPPIDLWSVGCILAEMLGRQPIFPGRDVLSQLKLIVTIVGVPDQQALKAIVHNEKAIDFIMQIARQAPPPQPLAERFPNAPAGACDLLCRLLEFDPAKRISAHEALRHPFLRPLHDLNTEPTAAAFDFSFESASDHQLRGLLDAECRRFLDAGSAALPVRACRISPQSRAGPPIRAGHPRLIPARRAWRVAEGRRRRRAAAAERRRAAPTYRRLRRGEASARSASDERWRQDGKAEPTCDGGRGSGLRRVG